MKVSFLCAPKEDYLAVDLGSRENKKLIEMSSSGLVCVSTSKMLHQFHQRNDWQRALILCTHLKALRIRLFPQSLFLTLDAIQQRRPPDVDLLETQFLHDFVLTEDARQPSLRNGVRDLLAARQSRSSRLFYEESRAIPSIPSCSLIVEFLRYTAVDRSQWIESLRVMHHMATEGSGAPPGSLLDLFAARMVALQKDVQSQALLDDSVDVVNKAASSIATTLSIQLQRRSDQEEVTPVVRHKEKFWRRLLGGHSMTHQATCADAVQAAPALELEKIVQFTYSLARFTHVVRKALNAPVCQYEAPSVTSHELTTSLVQTLVSTPPEGDSCIDKSLSMDSIVRPTAPVHTNLAIARKCTSVLQHLMEGHR